MKSIFAIIFLLSSTGALSAQTLGVDTITWNSSKAINDGNQLSLENKFVLYADKQIDWVQIASDETYSYQVTDVVGEWQDLSRQGQIEFKVKLGNREGSIFFHRTSKGVRVRIDMLREGVNLVPFEFIISNYSAN